MAAIYSRPIKALKQSTREIRQYHSDVRKVKTWCENHGILLKSWDNASSTDVCILSKSEYDVHDYRKVLDEDNESYFLSPLDYENYCIEHEIEWQSIKKNNNCINKFYFIDDTCIDHNCFIK